jgi:putative inorganic carbon (HCO3(-)) transporter
MSAWSLWADVFESGVPLGRRFKIPAGLFWSIAALVAGVPFVMAAFRFPHHPVIVILALGAVLALVLAILAEPYFGLLTVMLVIWWNVSNVLSLTFNFSWLLKILLFLMIVSWIYHALVDASPAPLKFPFRAPLLVFGSAFLITTITSDIPLNSINWCVEYLRALLIILLVINILRTPHRLAAAMDAILVAAILCSLPCVYQGITGSHFEFWGFGQIKFAGLFGTDFGWRPAGPIGDPNFLAMSLVVALPLAVVRTLQPGLSRMRRLIPLVALALMIPAIAFTYSRASMIGLAMDALLLAVFHHRRKLIVAAAVLAGVALFTQMPKDFIIRMMTLKQVPIISHQQNIADPSYRGRHSEELVALAMFKAHPIMGVGPGNYSLEYQQYNAKVGLDERTEQRDPHDWYLQIAAEMGLAGLLAFGYMLIAVSIETVKTIVRARRAGAYVFSELLIGVAIAMAAYLLMSVFLHAYIFRDFMMLVALAGAGWSITQSATAALARRAQAAG